MNQACIQCVAQTSIQQSIIYLKSKALPMGGGTVTYGNPWGNKLPDGLLSLAVSPYALATLEYYKRRAIV